MLRIVLIFPNYTIRDKFGEPSDQPLGLTYTAAVLEKKGYEINIIDANAENLKITQIRSRLMHMKPDVIGISCNYSPLHNPTIQTAAMIKNEFNIPVIVGGNHATAMAEYIISHSDDNIDFVIRGEGEVVMPNLLEALQGHVKLNDVKGITYREAGSVVSTPDAPLIDDLDKLPMPAYHLLPMSKYTRYNVITSRGCPYNCSYCASNIIFKRKVRYRSTKKVVDEIEYLFLNYGKKRFWFSDDTFTSNPTYLNKLMDELIKRNLNITWSCLTRVNLVSKDLLLKMKKAGCDYISYGVESGNQKMLIQMNKKISLSQVEKALQLTREAGLRMYTFFLVGIANESWDTIKDSYRLIIKTRPDGASFAVVIPLPGTAMCDDLINENLINFDSMEWDYLFCKIPGGKYEDYAAKLASKWCNLQPSELIKACKIGEALPLIIRFCDVPTNLRSDDINGILKLYSTKISSHIKDKQIFVETVKMYIDLLKSKKQSE